MKIDQMIRDKKNAEKIKATPELSETESSETHSLDDMDEEQRKLYQGKKIRRLTKNMARTLSIDYEQALKIVQMTE
jgi:endonuclease V-like protein UPF0215 family